MIATPLAVVPLPDPHDTWSMRRHLAHLSDEALVALVARGDEPALAELYDRVGRVAYGLAFRVLRDDRLAEDAVQEAFLGVWRTAAGFRAERAKASTWILTLVHRRAVDLVRREERRRADPLDDAPVAIEVAVPVAGSVGLATGASRGSALRRSSRRRGRRPAGATSRRIHVLAFARSARKPAAVRQTPRNASCTASSARRSSRRTRNASP